MTCAVVFLRVRDFWGDGSGTGYYSGTGKVMLPFLGARGHISIRVVLSWLLFSHLGLNAVAFATGFGGNQTSAERAERYHRTSFSAS